MMVIKILFVIFAVTVYGFHSVLEKRLSSVLKYENKIYSGRKYGHFSERDVLDGSKKKEYDSFMNNLSFNFLQIKNFNKKSKNDLFSNIQDIIDPYDGRMMHFAALVYARRYEKKKEKNSLVPLSIQWEDKSNDAIIQRLGFYKGELKGVLEKSKRIKKNQSHVGYFHKLFGRILSSRLINIVKYNTEYHVPTGKDVKYRISSREKGVEYPIVNKHKTHSYMYSNRINIRSFILGHRPKTCHSVFEGSGINGEIRKCLEKMLKKTRCRNSFDPTCICDSVFYLDLVKVCLHGSSQLNIQLVYTHHYSVCKNPILPPTKCLHTYKPHQKIVSCPKPHKNFGFGRKSEECIEAAIRKSLCRGLYDASCLCDSISFKNEVSQCITGSISSVDMIYSFHKTLCKKPLRLSGCTKLSIKELTRPKVCESMFANVVFGNDVRMCLENLAINSRCGNNVNSPCICDSFLFMSSFTTCFQSYPYSDSENISSLIKSSCSKSYLLGKCSNENKNSAETKICPGFYKYFGFSNNTQKCLQVLIGKSACDNPYDIVCLCDSVSFINGMQKCFSGNAENKFPILRDFYEILCFDPKTFDKCDKNV
ncbi:hypothetical protein PORY_001547 [Pneumocystis oryctolagi]|uniref:Uncharacterized protein n=1 Tax=Pneumocystis oryctolagi TaxID=42067 RepID=A0ACB7CEF5_9ASCO|nr:hypothetical protein PORY_001547 [Pneumocystis oryctolagi]